MKKDKNWTRFWTRFSPGVLIVPVNIGGLWLTTTPTTYGMKGCRNSCLFRGTGIILEIHGNSHFVWCNDGTGYGWASEGDIKKHVSK